MTEIPFDLHTHTSLSFDGESGAEDMVKRAVSLGMKHYAITDHVEINLFRDKSLYPDKETTIENAVREASALIPALKERYADKIELLYGAELGQSVHDPALAEKVLAENPYDFIIGSCHMLRGYDDFYFLDYKRNDPQKLMGLYFRELLETAETADFDVLGHLTYPLRYIYKQGGEVDMEKFGGVIDEIFRALIKNGKGIEINTSDVGGRLGIVPELTLVKRYRELGGEILTIGSDAHRTSDLGKGIAEGVAAAKEAGFGKIAIYKKRKPGFIDIS